MFIFVRPILSKLRHFKPQWFTCIPLTWKHDNPTFRLHIVFYVMVINRNKTSTFQYPGWIKVKYTLIMISLNFVNKAYTYV